MAKCTRLC